MHGMSHAMPCGFTRSLLECLPCEVCMPLRFPRALVLLILCLTLPVWRLEVPSQVGQQDNSESPAQPDEAGQAEQTRP
ncbi:MAG: hypothetical protein JW384_00120 [Nitrosomonadaceae bacterium]|nr:hypothetical protein [Nitrosomonadaceae bacterium]